jgi:hypothetical protein
MKVIDSSRESANISVTRDELLIMCAVLNEVCNGIELFEFETRIGADRGYVTGLLRELGSAVDRMEPLQAESEV